MNITLTTISLIVFAILPTQNKKITYKLSPAKSNTESTFKLLEGGKTLVCNSKTLPQLFSIALTRGKGVLDPTKAMYKEDLRRIVEKKYNYQLSVPNEFKSDIFNIMFKILTQKFPNTRASTITIGRFTFLQIEQAEGRVLVRYKQ